MSVTLQTRPAIRPTVYARPQSSVAAAPAARPTPITSAATRMLRLPKPVEVSTVTGKTPSPAAPVVAAPTTPNFQAATPANINMPPALLGQLGLNYGSDTSRVGLMPTATFNKPFIVGAIPTGPEAAQLYESRIANAFNPEWQTLVADAAARNGGLGNDQDGYLAFSNEYGFVRLKNENLTPEQNRRIAEISLTMGVPVEKLPSRADRNTADSVEWADQFIGSYDAKMAEFQANPSAGITINDGKRRYVMGVDETSGRVMSFNYKKKGGLAGFFQKAMKFISPIADVASVVFPGIGTAIAQGVKFVGNAIATGKVMAKDLMGAVAGFVPGIGNALGFTMNAATTGLVNGVLNGGASLIDSNGKTGFGSILSSLGSSLLGTGGGFDAIARQGMNVLGNALDGKKISAGDLMGLLPELGRMLNVDMGSLVGSQSAEITTAGESAKTGNGLPSWANDLLDQAGIRLDRSDIQLIKGIGKAAIEAIRGGEIDAKAIADVLGQLKHTAAATSVDQDAVQHLFDGMATAVDSEQVRLQDLLAQVVERLRSAAVGG